jgi:glycosyltransferase involved in cell wall biosynthesis
MFLSVVIPTYNRLPILRQCLAALEGQQLEPMTRWPGLTRSGQLAG